MPILTVQALNLNHRIITDTNVRSSCIGANVLNRKTTNARIQSNWLEFDIKETKYKPRIVVAQIDGLGHFTTILKNSVA